MYKSEMQSIMKNGKDPVSGHDKPVGSLPEEVRDDVPALLSEGEFVVPADVVRYIGLDKLMQLRDEAKQGLARMEEIGQMGNGEEVAGSNNLHGGVDIDAMIDAVGTDADDYAKYNEGGDVVPESLQYEAPDPQDSVVPTYTAPQQQAVPVASAHAGSGMSLADYYGSQQVPEYKEVMYIGPNGERISITFLNGKPIDPIPDGFYPEGSPEAKKNEAVPAVTVGSPDIDPNTGGDDNSDPPSDPPPEDNAPDTAVSAIEEALKEEHNNEREALKDKWLQDYIKENPSSPLAQDVYELNKLKGNMAKIKDGGIGFALAGVPGVAVGLGFNFIRQKFLENQIDNAIKDNPSWQDESFALTARHDLNLRNLTDQGAKIKHTMGDRSVLEVLQDQKIAKMMDEVAEEDNAKRQQDIIDEMNRKIKEDRERRQAEEARKKAEEAAKRAREEQERRRAAEEEARKKAERDKYRDLANIIRGDDDDNTDVTQSPAYVPPSQQPKTAPHPGGPGTTYTPTYEDNSNDYSPPSSTPSYSDSDGITTQSSDTFQTINKGGLIKKRKPRKNKKRN